MYDTFGEDLYSFLMHRRSSSKRAVMRLAGCQIIRHERKQTHVFSLPLGYEIPSEWYQEPSESEEEGCNEEDGPDARGPYNKRHISQKLKDLGLQDAANQLIGLLKDLEEGSHVSQRQKEFFFPELKKLLADKILGPELANERVTSEQIVGNMHSFLERTGSQGSFFLQARIAYKAVLSAVFGEEKHRKKKTYVC
jgi:hypothetical protein